MTMDPAERRPANDGSNGPSHGAGGSAGRLRTALAEREEVRVSTKLREVLRSSLSPNTLRAYTTQWRLWSQWCSEKDSPPLPALSLIHI